MIVTEMIEESYRGHETTAADPTAVFLWLSDSPALNAQSKRKIEDASDVIPPHRLVTIQHPFNVERLDAGARLLSEHEELTSTSLLTTSGDRQERTIWQIIENTAKTQPVLFYFVIDEGTRGCAMAEKAKAAQTRNEKRAA